MNKKIQLSILSMFIAAALIGSVIAYGDSNMAYAGGKNKKHNDSGQLIEQSALTGEASTCDSTEKTIAGCNNLDFTVNLNGGNSAAAQQ